MSSSEKESVSHQIWMLMMKLYNENSKLFTAQLKEVGLNPTQFEVLHFIREHEPVDQKTIATHLQLTQGNITHCMHKLDAMGLISCEKEWKTKYISLSKKGRAVMCDVIPRQQVQIDLALSGLSSTQQRDLYQLLQQLAETCKQ